MRPRMYSAPINLMDAIHEPTAVPIWALDPKHSFITNIAESSFRHTPPIDSSIDTHQVQSVRRSSVRQERCAHTTKNRTEVLCPRVTQALPVNAPKSIFQNSILYRAANSVDSPPSCGEGV